MTPELNMIAGMLLGFLAGWLIKSLHAKLQARAYALRLDLIASALRENGTKNDTRADAIQTCADGIRNHLA